MAPNGNTEMYFVSCLFFFYLDLLCWSCAGYFPSGWLENSLQNVTALVSKKTHWQSQ